MTTEVEMREDKEMNKLKTLFLLGVMCLCLVTPGITTYAVSDNDTEDEDKKDEASKEEKADAKNTLYNYFDNLVAFYDIDKETRKELEDIINRSKKHISDSEMNASELTAYVTEMKGWMDKVITRWQESVPKSTSDFLVVGDNIPAMVGEYGQEVHFILPIFNMGDTQVEDVVVTPKVSTSVKEWPFEITQTGYSEQISEIPGSTNKEEAFQNHRQVQYVFQTRKDVLTGYYKVEFDVKYRRNGEVEKAVLTTFIKTKGAPGSGNIDQTEDGKSSTPRIVVTGFETDPKEVYAGATFNLSIHVKNTSKRTAVNNIEFNLEAAVEGKDENTTYSAFLPTSGSNTVYIDSIPIGGEADLEIEMTAKADLVQKPYAINLKMAYEDEKYNPFTATSSVSIPVKQASKFDTSTPEVMPESITVGSQSNVMFSIYNTGKTTLYNVQVKFKGDSISGGEAFIGKVESGATGSVDTMVTGIAPTMDEGKIVATISYEDDAGNITTYDKEMQLFVTEQLPEEGIVMPGEMVGEEPASNKAVVVIIVIAAAIVVIIAVVIIFFKLKKKKKLSKELAEDLLDIGSDEKE